MTRQIEAAIRAIADRHDGRLTPDLVVEAARDKASPLHACFTWDVQEAAQECWRSQARALIRSVRVEVTTTQFTVQAPAYVRDPSALGNTQGYASLGRLRTDEDMAREACLSEFSRAAAALTRARAIAAALGMSGEVEDVRERIAMLSERARQVAAAA